MPRYFFHVRDDIRDEEGQELPDEGAALSTALEEARILGCESITQHATVHLNHQIVVTDNHGDQLFAVTFGEAFTIDL